MVINFFQGQENLFSNNEEKEIEKIKTIKNKISEFFNMKNVHFLFGSGTSCPAIPNMKGLFEYINESVSFIAATGK